MQASKRLTAATKKLAADEFKAASAALGSFATPLFVFASSVKSSAPATGGADPLAVCLRSISQRLIKRWMEWC